MLKKKRGGGAGGVTFSKQPTLDLLSALKNGKGRHIENIKPRVANVNFTEEI